MTRPPVNISDQARDEIRAKGRAHWDAMHVAADKREPFDWQRIARQWINPQPRKKL